MSQLVACDHGKESQVVSHRMPAIICFAFEVCLSPHVICLPQVLYHFEELICTYILRSLSAFLEFREPKYQFALFHDMFF